MQHPIIVDFVMIYRLIPLFCFLIGTPSVSINSSFFRLNPDMRNAIYVEVEITLLVLFNLSEHIVLSALKYWLNSREYSSPLMETSLNVHSFLMTASPKFSISRKNLIVGLSFSTYGK